LHIFGIAHVSISLEPVRLQHAVDANG
jgi:hypothetical protein